MYSEKDDGNNKKIEIHWRSILFAKHEKVLVQ